MFRLSQPIKSLSTAFLLLIAASVFGANVGPTGYTNAFGTQPLAADWATASINGAPGDNYDLDVDVNARIAATNITTQVSLSAADPVGIGLRASWSSSGLYLATRPNGNRYATLMGKFVNQTGSNATEVALSYLLAFGGNAVAEENGKGTRVFYSLSGESNSWNNLPTLNTTATNGSSIVTTNIAVNWPGGTALYILWVDDNSVSGNDVASEIDNFSLLITASTPLPVNAVLNTPGHGAVFLSGSAITATITITNGSTPYMVRSWTNSGAGNTTFQSAGSPSAPPYDLELSNLAAGTYDLYATVTDQNGAGTSAGTLTNTFVVADPITLMLIEPDDGAVFDHTASIVGSAAVSGGHAPYIVQFYLDGTAAGVALVSPPFTHDFGALPIGYHTIRAAVSDGSGWTSNSPPHTIRVTGPLSVALTPTNGASLYTSQPLILTATIIGGEPPYTVSFYTNGELAGAMGSAPYTRNLGVMPVGSYTSYVHVADSSIPAQQIFSTTNIITVVPTPPITHAVQVSLDGLGAKYLEFFLTNAPDQFPNFVRLTTEGAFTLNARCDYDVSETVPNHTTMFTGRPVLQPAGQSDTVHHGYNNNFPGSGDTFHISGNPNVPYKASMFDVAHDYGLSTALYTGKTRLSICERSYNETNGAPDLIGADDGRDKIDFASVADVSGAAIANEVNLLIQNVTNEVPTHYSFIHIAEPDLTGHSFGWRSANWSNIVRQVDAQIGRIMDAIDTHPLLAGHTALIVTADHGGGGVLATGHTEAYHITNYTIPFFVRAPGIPAGTDLYTLFANRGNPGTNRTDYNTQPQPIRNGDASNLALGFLGLPPIPGSFMVPAFFVPTVSLTVARFQGQVGIFWADAAADYALETTESLSPPVQWQPITNGIATNDTTRIFTTTNAMELPARFFRLRKVNP